MLRLFYLATAVSVGVTSIITQITYSRPVFSNSQYPEVQSKVDLPICYIQTADGRTLNLQRLCGKISPVNNNSSSRIPKAKFRRGSGSGYASDSV